MPPQPSPLSRAGSVRLYLVHTNIYLPAIARNWAFEPMTPWAQLAGVSITDIMDAAAWRTPVTSAKHYLKDLPNLKGRFGQAILTTAGSSGGAKTTTA